MTDSETKGQWLVSTSSDVSASASLPHLPNAASICYPPFLAGFPFCDNKVLPITAKALIWLPLRPGSDLST